MSGVGMSGTEVPPTPLTVDGATVEAAEGDTVAAALLRHGVRAWRRTPDGAPRGLFCGIGVCFDCTVTADGEQHVRACLTPVRPGMVVDTTLNTTLKGNPE